MRSTKRNVTAAVSGAEACHEGAIGMVDGKARLLRDDYCDGLGDCLPTCPTGAIRFIEKDTLAYDEAAVKANLARKQAEARQNMTDAQQTAGTEAPVFHGCPAAAP